MTMANTLATRYPLGTHVTVTRNGRDYRGTVSGYLTRGPMASYDGILYTYPAYRGGPLRTSSANPMTDIITIRKGL